MTNINILEETFDFELNEQELYRFQRYEETSNTRQLITFNSVFAHVDVEINGETFNFQISTDTNDDSVFYTSFNSNPAEDDLYDFYEDLIYEVDGLREEIEQVYDQVREFLEEKVIPIHNENNIESEQCNW